MKTAAMTRLLIRAWDSPSFTSTRRGDPFEVQVNPESFSISYAMEYKKKQSKGTSSLRSRWVKNPPRKLTLEFLFDGTGAIPNLSQNSDLNDPRRAAVASQINRFEFTVFKVKGKRHEPNYLSLEWGELNFLCRLESMDITYKLFDPDGQPLRASVRATFFEVVRDDLRLREENRSSPDVTHAVTVKEGDTLPQLAEEVYGDRSYYIAVAQAQKLIQFRNLQAGTTILFPSKNQTNAS